MFEQLRGSGSGVKNQQSQPKKKNRRLGTTAQIETDITHGGSRVLPEGIGKRELFKELGGKKR